MVSHPPGLDWLDDFLRRHRLPHAFADSVEAIYRPLARVIHERQHDRRQPLVVGVCGPQGSGKTTAALALEQLLRVDGLSCAILSLDDLYLTHAERQRLAATVHPLLATRGPPGTHDVGLGLAAFDALARPGEVRLPRFDKASDDRAPTSAWPVIRAPVDIILFEGWCVGARPQPQAELAAPVNGLEATEDADGVWRGYVNAALAGPYQTLFARIDLLFLLKAPAFDCILDWRMEQEHKLREAEAGDPRGSAGLMSDAAIARFIQHYERLTRFIDAEMPARADAVIALDRERRLTALRLR